MQLGALSEKPVAPVGERQCVVRTEIFPVPQPQIAGPPHRQSDVVHRRQAAARKDIPLDKIDAPPVLVVAVVGNRDRLQQHHPVPLEVPGANTKKLVQVLVAHRFDHLHRHQLVVLPRQVPVIAQQDLDAVSQARLLDPLAGQFVLSLGDRGRRHAAPVVAGGVEGKTAPAGTDLQHVIGGGQLQLATDQFVLGPRRLGQAVGRGGEHPRGIAERLV